MHGSHHQRSQGKKDLLLDTDMDVSHQILKTSVQRQKPGKTSDTKTYLPEMLFPETKTPKITLIRKT